MIYPSFIFDLPSANKHATMKRLCPANCSLVSRND